ncbi:unnamed protein product [Ostreobium quekettii]|uniref:CBS domain-containing protein n=1 Tax=Ostreobium quekettii TaxID=121088 RepID=A0A8S1IUN7_9CHLO|nr:unnamed protein product [Ostreobium quekettii]|eukprot:evm.model.scf_217.2 EVM.evm.TU.scf_217.2   scf_217:6584-12232(-)
MGPPPPLPPGASSLHQLQNFPAAARSLPQASAFKRPSGRSIEGRIDSRRSLGAASRIPGIRLGRRLRELSRRRDWSGRGGGGDERLRASALEGSISDAALDPENLNPAVSQVMNRDVVVLTEDMPIRKAMQAFLSNGISGAPVVDAVGRIVGVLSETDIIATDTGNTGADGSAREPVPIKFLPLFVADSDREDIRALLEQPVGQLMSRDPYYVEPGTPVVHAAKLMIEKQVNRLPVCIDGQVVGILTRGDVLQCMIWEMLMAGTPDNEDG